MKPKPEEVLDATVTPQMNRDIMRAYRFVRHISGDRFETRMATICRTIVDWQYLVGLGFLETGLMLAYPLEGDDEEMRADVERSGPFIKAAIVWYILEGQIK